MKRLFDRFLGRSAPAAERKMIDALAEAGDLDPEDLKIVRGILRLSDLRAQDLVKPWNKIERVSTRATHTEALAAFVRTRFTRLPVVEGDGTLSGFLHAKDFLSPADEGGGSWNGDVEGIGSLVREPLLAPPWRRGDDLLRTFQSEGQAMAFVISPTGEPQGIVTLEDLVRILWPAEKIESADASPAPPADAGVEAAGVVEEATVAGAIEGDEAELLQKYLRLRHRPILEAMVSRTEVDWIDVSASVEEARERVRMGGHSRLIVCEGTFERPIGILHFRTLLPRPAETGEDPLSGDLRELASPILFLPESMRIDTALSRLRSERREMAVVVDESGGAEGIVTREDLLEELLGEIEDEVNARAPRILPVRVGVWIIAGETELSLAESTTGFPARVRAGGASSEARTLAGRIEEALQRIPREGERFAIGAWSFEILRATPTRILRVRMEGPGVDTPLVSR